MIKSADFHGGGVDYLPYNTPRLNSFKNEIIIEKFIREGRENHGKKGGAVIDDLNFEFCKINFYVIGQVVSKSIWAYLNGYEPKVTVKNYKTGTPLWNMLFKDIDSIQPTKVTVGKSLGLPLLSQSGVYDSRFVSFWSKAYAKYVIPNEMTDSYCQNEYDRIIKGKRCLGVLVRGTDYTSLKPRGHAVQPTIEMVLSKVREKMPELCCDYIYLATEEKRIYDIFCEAFPGRVLINKRQWFDSYYQGYKLIGQVKHDRDDDDYLTSLEYFSSIMLLSKCNALIAGNCGGSVGAVLLNNFKYEYLHLFDLGKYL